MSDRFATSIEIGGLLHESKVQDLIDLINSSDMGLEWGDPKNPAMEIKKDDLIDLLNKTDEQGFKKNKTLILVDDERAWGDTHDEEEMCRDLNLTYKVLVEPKYEYPGELRFWEPKILIQDVVEINCDADGFPIATKEDLQKMLDLMRNNDIQEVIEILKNLTKKYVIPPLEIVK